MSHDPFLDLPQDRPASPASLVMDPILNVPSAFVAGMIMIGLKLVVPIAATSLRIQRALR